MIVRLMRPLQGREPVGGPAGRTVLGADFGQRRARSAVQRSSTKAQRGAKGQPAIGAVEPGRLSGDGHQRLARRRRRCGIERSSA